MSIPVAVDCAPLHQSVTMPRISNPLEPTIFHEAWWLEIACSGRCEVVEVTNGGKTVGRLPYIIYRRFGLKSVEMPVLTHFLGPGLFDGEGSANNIFLKRLGITRELIQKLPSASLTRMKMHHGITDVVAFQEQGFRSSVQFTHEIYPLNSDVLWSNMRNKTRNVIRKAQELVQVRDMLDTDQFIEFYAQNLKLKGVRNFLNLPVGGRLIAESVARGRGRIIAAYDENNTLLAANFYAWDHTSYYFLLTTRSLNSGNGTTSLLLWDAIQDASKRKLIFDSDGLNSSGGILFLAGLGGNIKPRYIVTKIKPTGLILEGIHQTVWGNNFFVRG